MTAYAWPDALSPRDFGFYHLDADMSGGAAIGGGEQFVISPGPRWGASMTLQVFDRATVLEVRKLRARLKGRANYVRLPNFDGRQLPWPTDDLTGKMLSPAVTRDKSLDGTDYESPAIPAASEINAELSAPASLRETTVHIRVNQGGEIQPGMQFGISQQRIHEIAEIESVVGLVTTCSIWPPLRDDYPEDEPVLFTDARCAMRCVNLNDEMRKLDLMRFATLNLEFVEYF